MRPRAVRAWLPGAVLLLAVVGWGQGAAAQGTEADVFVAEGVLALEDKKYEEALGHFRLALEREADHIEALYYSGVAKMAQGKPAEAVPFLEQARRKSATDASVAFQLGLAYLGLNQYDPAGPLLEEVFEKEPTLDSLGYYVGFLRHQKGRYQEALRAFRAGRTTDPDIAQLTRFYTGLALGQLGLPAQAAAEVEQALRLRPASPLTGPAERLRDTFRAATQREQRLRVDATLGSFFDGNATVRPNGKKEDTTVHDLRRPRHDTTGESFSLQLEYDWFKSGPWVSTASYSFLTTYNNDLPALNLVDHLGTLGLTRQDTLFDMPLEASTKYAYDFMVLDDDEFIQRHSLSLSGTLTESAIHLTTLQLRGEVKEYSEVRPLARQEFQDGVNGMLGGVHVFRFEQERHNVKVGYEIDLENTRGRNFDYLGHRLLAGGLYTLPWHDIRLSYDYYVHIRDYRNKHSSLPVDSPDRRKRSDTEHGHAIRLAVPLPRDFTLSADVQITRSRSNIPVYGYDREVFTLSLGWQY